MKTNSSFLAIGKAFPDPIVRDNFNYQSFLWFVQKKWIQSISDILTKLRIFLNFKDHVLFLFLFLSYWNDTGKCSSRKCSLINLYKWMEPCSVLTRSTHLHLLPPSPLLVSWPMTGFVLFRKGIIYNMYSFVSSFVC